PDLGPISSSGAYFSPYVQHFRPMWTKRSIVVAFAAFFGPGRLRGAEVSHHVGIAGDQPHPEHRILQPQHRGDDRHPPGDGETGVHVPPRLWVVPDLPQASHQAKNRVLARVLRGFTISSVAAQT